MWEAPDPQTMMRTQEARVSAQMGKTSAAGAQGMQSQDKETKQDPSLQNNTIQQYLDRRNQGGSL